MGQASSHGPRFLIDTRRPGSAAGGRSDLLYALPDVGTFYRAPDLRRPLRRDRRGVKKGQTLCIIEAMKLMNEIESEVDGTIEESFVENGKPSSSPEAVFHQAARLSHDVFQDMIATG